MTNTSIVVSDESEGDIFGYRTCEKCGATIHTDNMYIGKDTDFLCAKCYEKELIAEEG